MDNILSITDKLKQKKSKEKDNYRSRSEVVRRMVQCSSCGLTCAMCGVHLEGPNGCCQGPSSRFNPNLCEHCRTEYMDFLKLAKKGDISGILWHNEEWLGLWSAWVKYQEAIKAFRNSKEFKQLTKESE